MTDHSPYLYRDISKLLPSNEILELQSLLGLGRRLGTKQSTTSEPATGDPDLSSILAEHQKSRASDSKRVKAGGIFVWCSPTSFL